MKLGVSIGGPGSGDIQDDVAYVQQAERLGVEHAWSAEAWGRDAVTPLAYLAARTERILLGTGIMQISARVPAMTAMTALSLSALSGNRFILGLGVSGPQVVEGLHGVAFARPLARLRETVEIVRKAMAGEKLRHAGREFDLPRPGGQGKALRLDLPPDPGLRIYLATLAPRALELTGAIADGWLGTSFSPDHSQAHLAFLSKGAEAAGRTLQALDLQAQVTVAIGEDVDRMVTELKPGVAFTLGAMGSASANFYNEAFRRAGYEEDARAVQALWLAGKRDAAAARVPAELVLRYGLIGTPEMIRRRLALYRRAGISTLNLRFGAANAGRRMEALAEAVDVIRG